MKRYLTSPSSSSSQNADDDGTPTKKTKIVFGSDSDHPYDPAKQYKFISFNVNGLKALMGKDRGATLTNMIESEKPTAICLQETKLQDLDSLTQQYGTILGESYKAHFAHCSVKKGYSGTAIFTLKHKSVPKPLSVTYGLQLTKEEDCLNLALDDGLLKGEGRVITVEYPDLYLVNTYVPNSGQKLERLNERTNQWDKAMGQYLDKLQKKKKPVVWCGDLNVSILDIDIHEPKKNAKSAGFTPQERESFRDLLSTYKLVDTFRKFYPEQANSYTYWGYRFNMREKDKGWRLDYFITSESLNERLVDSYILKSVMGSDHCPIGLVLNRAEDVTKSDGDTNEGSSGSSTNETETAAVETCAESEHTSEPSDDNNE